MRRARGARDTPKIAAPVGIYRRARPSRRARLMVIKRERAREKTRETEFPGERAAFDRPASVSLANGEQFDDDGERANARNPGRNRQGKTWPLY